MIRGLKTINQWLLCAVEVILVVLILSMVSLGFGQVVLRKVFSKGISGINIFLQFAVLWIAFLGAILATHRQKHIKIDLLTQVLSKKKERLRLIIVNLAGLIFSAILCKGGLNFFRVVNENEWTIGNNPVWNISFFVGFGLICLEFAFNLLDVVYPQDKTE